MNEKLITSFRNGFYSVWLEVVSFEYGDYIAYINSI